MESIIAAFVVGLGFGIAVAYGFLRSKYPEVAKAVETAVVSYEKKLVETAVQAING